MEPVQHLLHGTSFLSVGHLIHGILAAWCTTASGRRMHKAGYWKVSSASGHPRGPTWQRG
jgi:hypothetical protein